ncbi:hypothetical protein HU200_010735 [Digitaria exilis]|uniref:Uncharacterized protein n=1 Tax=Digitaria exilis TaxID=1010633 RepID=A0A835FID4_9POAL|nr:hypothetical protein HU200_010735 [Digitaria exilis]
MGCISSKMLAKSGSFQEKGSLSHSFQRSNMIEEIILSSSKSNGDQFLALLCASNSTARKAKEPEQSPAAAVAEPAAKIETINVSELLAGLDEDNNAVEQSERENGDRTPAQCVVSDAGADGRARSFRTVEDFDALVAAQQDGEPRTAAVAATAEAAEISGGGSSGGKGEGAPEAAGERRRARARQLGELKVPAAAAFDFSKSGSLRDWLRHGGQIFSPGSYVTPKFGTAAPAATAEHEGDDQKPSEKKQQEEHALFDPELVAQFERAMEQLSEDEGRVLEEILEALESQTGEKEDGTAAFGEVSSDQPVAEGVQQV